MGEPVGKALRRTSHGMSTHLADPCSTSPWVRSSHYLKMSNKPPCKALKVGLPMAVYATARLIVLCYPKFFSSIHGCGWIARPKINNRGPAIVSVFSGDLFQNKHSSSRHLHRMK